MPEVQQHTLEPLTKQCLHCRQRMWLAYTNQRTLITLHGPQHLQIKVYRCGNHRCSRFHKPVRPELESRLSFPHCQYGLDVLLAIRNAIEHGWTTYSKRIYKSQTAFVNDNDRLKTSGIAIPTRTFRRIMDRYKAVVEKQPLIDRQVLKEIGRQGFSIIDIFEINGQKNNNRCMSSTRDKRPEE